MEEIKLLTIPANYFSGYAHSYEESHFIVLGVPFDGTSSYKPGSRFGPSAIREASSNIETFSMRAKEDLSRYWLCDIGNIVVTHGNLTDTLKSVERVTSSILKTHRFPILLGGEHSVTYGAVKAVREAVKEKGKELTVIQFDAHMDLRDDYLGEKWSHATVMRRIVEEIGVPHLVQVGIRAPSQEEYDFAKKNQVNFFTSDEANNNPQGTVEKIKKLIRGSPTYVSIDIDCLDPSAAPGVGNPEPEGINLTTLLNVLQGIVNRSVMIQPIEGFDVVEVSPPNDPTGQTAVTAAKLTMELLGMSARVRSSGEA